MKEEGALRIKLENALKEQRKEVRKNRRRGERSIADRFEELTPLYYAGFICSLDKTQFFELMSELGDWQKEYLWNCLDDENLNDILWDVLKIENSETFLRIVPTWKLEKYLWKASKETLYKMFTSVNPSKKSYLMQLINPVQLADFLRMSKIDDHQQFVDFLMAEAYNEEEQGVYKKMSQMPPKTIAEFLENIDESEVICKLLEHLNGEKVGEVCQYITNLYELIEKSDFQLLDYADYINVWNLDDVEWQDLYYACQEREIDLRRALGVEGMIEIYQAVEMKCKVDILLHFLTTDEMAQLYQILAKSKRLEMLEIIAKGEYYDAERLHMCEQAILILTHQEKLSYWEKLALNDFKSKLL